MLTRFRDASAIATPRAMRDMSSFLLVFAGIVALVATLVAGWSPEAHRGGIRIVALVSVFWGLVWTRVGLLAPRRSYLLFVAVTSVMVTIAVLLSGSQVFTLAMATFYVYVLVAAVFFFSWRGMVFELVFCAVLAAYALHERDVPAGAIVLAGCGALLLVVVIASLARTAGDTHIDQATMVLSRRAIGAALEHAMRTATIDGGQLAVATLSVDNLAQLSRDQGKTIDHVLRMAAARWQQRLGDLGSIGRLGHVSFGIVLPGMSPSAAAELVDELLALTPYGATSSAGLAPWQLNDTISTITGRTDIALHDAHVAGGGVTVVYGDPTRVGSEIEAAIANGEMFLEYQAAIVLHDRSIRSYEALVRWQHPTRGRIPPMSFIQNAEKTGAIHALGIWILDEACRVVAANTEPIPLRIAINASISELGDPEYVHRVAAAVAKHGIDPERIAIEVTEEIFDRDEESVLTGLRRLKEIGVHVAIDDFGSGYSSLRWLDHYPVNTLKIDAAFIATVTDEHQSVPVLEGILGIAKTLGLTVVIEGIETEAQARYLDRIGADYPAGKMLGQGYYFARPAPLDAGDRLPAAAL